MENNRLPSIEEHSGISDRLFTTLQAQLALSGVELHRVTNERGGDAFSINVNGQLRTLDTLPQVQAYARCIGVVLVMPAAGGGAPGPATA